MPPEVLLSGMNPPANLSRKVCGSSDDAPQVREGVCLAVVLPRCVEDYLRCRRTRKISMHIVSVLLVEMARLKAQTPCTKNAILRSNQHGDREMMHASSVCGIPQTARRAHCSFRFRAKLRRLLSKIKKADKHDRPGLRGYVQINKYTLTHTHTRTDQRFS